MLSLYQSNKSYFNLLLLFLICACGMLSTSEKGDTIIYINQFVNHSADVFFRYITSAGDKFLVFGCIVLLLLRNRKTGIAALSSFAIAGFFALIFVLGPCLFPHQLSSQSFHFSLGKVCRVSDSQE